MSFETTSTRLPMASMPRHCDFTEDSQADTEIYQLDSALLDTNSDKSSTIHSFLRRNLLQLACFTLHVGLVLTQVLLLISGLCHYEHYITFPVDLQTTVSFWATALTTGFATAYTALLVFLAQKLAMRRNLASLQPLTKTHDSIRSWAGFGAAMATLYSQLSASVSVFGSLHVMGYLGCISLLHVTIPTILSAQTFDSFTTVNVTTLGFPEYANSTAQNATNVFMTTIPTQFLPWIGNLNGFETLGLFNGTLYEVLNDTNLESGEAQVSAIGFNVSCGYIPAVLNFFDDSGWNITLGAVGTGVGDIIGQTSSSGFGIPFRQNTVFLAGDIYNNEFNGGFLLENSIVLYTPNVVLDSEGQTGFPVELEPETGNSSTITQLQFLQCSNSLVPQSGTVDTQSRILAGPSLRPSIYRTQSEWVSSADLEFESPNSTLLGGDLWSELLTADTLAISNNSSNPEGFLMEYLGLDPLAIVPAVLKLHDIENSLSVLFSTLFWIGGQSIQPDLANSDGSMIPPVLGVSSTVTQQATQLGRLDINPVGVWLSLATSLVLLLLCVMMLPGWVEPQTRVQTIGLLQTVWLWYHHAGRSHSIKDVKKPTARNLRTMGTTTIRLANANARGKWQRQSIHAASKIFHFSVGDVSRPDPPANTNTMRALNVTVHIFLILVHLTLLGIGLVHLEHRIIFSVDLQSSVSFWAKVVATAFGVICYSALLYCTQTLAISCAVRKYSTITSTHDSLTSWAGVGSSLSTLYNQISLPASVAATSSIFAYLAAISLLHVTTPALFSVETFNLAVQTTVETEGVPEWNDTNHNATLAYIENMAQFLPWIGNLDQSQTPGLFNGTLYDVLVEAYPGQIANVSALGFNITCGYLPAVEVGVSPPVDGFYNISFTSTGEWVAFPDIGPNVISLSPMDHFFKSTIADPADSNSITLLTSANVIDSNGNTGVPAATQQGTNLQFLRCSHSFLSQNGTVDAGSKAIIPSSLEPTIEKDQSVWFMYESDPETPSDETLLQGSAWAQIMASLAASPASAGGSDRFSPGDLYLMSQLGMNVASPEGNETLYLHDIENALSKLVASLFWIGAHIQLPTLESSGTFDPPALAAGDATLQQTSLASRLNISLLAVSLGFSASILLLGLAISFCTGADGPTTYLNGLGFLQIIWVFQHHPELSEILEHVDDPTDYNLRVAGLVKVRLADAEGVVHL
ncbi:hypothetical protein DFH07DRAFT_825880 [Mycena maculata]|uniref:Uncharacterized protein n=1 Tax=Mycena maculata TaxID=230809 RepID=A0AAD7IW90_9AGAR|nr:hypothetical protein DFH07DRAFT_825880 [Mycena maculata]